jgi:carboxyl-terminal processing protease
MVGSASLAAGPEQGDSPIAPLQSAFARVVTPGEQADMYRELLATVLERVQRSYATEVDVPALVAVALQVIEPLPPGEGVPADVFKKAINEALRTLDPYSRYLDPRAHGVQRSDSSGSFGGLGLEVEAGEDGVRVLAPMPGSPAARAGLQRGDVIVRVDDQPLLGVPLADAIARMRGAPGSPVTITVRRPRADHEIRISLTRDIIRRQAVRWSMDDDVLVLSLATFNGPVSAALEQAIAQATASAVPRAVVLDMRGNPGGLLREAVLTADAFLNAGDITSIRGRTPGSQRTWQADAAELLPGLPMVVLIDGRSASAAELVAAALQDNGRAKVMGQRSYGKGTVQSTYPLGQDRGALKLTTSFYHAPSGRTVQKAGVAPDIELVTAAPAEGTEAPKPRIVAETSALPAGTVRVEQARCAARRKMADPALSCAVAFLLAGTVEAFAE